MKLAFFCLAILAVCVYQSVGYPQQNETPREAEEEDIVRKPFRNPHLIQRLLQYPIGVLRIILSDEKHRPEIPPVHVPPEEEPKAEPEEGEEEPVTEEEGEWQVLELNDTSPIVKSLISVPTRCKDNQGLVGGRCRQVV